MKVLITGSRDFSNYSVFKKVCDLALSKQVGDVYVVKCGKNNADNYAETYGFENGHQVITFASENIEDAVKMSDVSILFWDGYSKNTFKVKNLCEKLGVESRVVLYKKYEDNF